MFEIIKMSPCVQRVECVFFLVKVRGDKCVSSYNFLICRNKNVVI